MSTRQFKCPSCRVDILIKLPRPGMTFRCKKCRNKIKIPFSFTLSQKKSSEIKHAVDSEIKYPVEYPVNRVTIIHSFGKAKFSLHKSHIVIQEKGSLQKILYSDLQRFNLIATVLFQHTNFSLMIKLRDGKKYLVTDQVDPYVLDITKDYDNFELFVLFVKVLHQQALPFKNNIAFTSGSTALYVFLVGFTIAFPTLIVLLNKHAIFFHGLIISLVLYIFFMPIHANVRPREYNPKDLIEDELPEQK